jgi:hypothetical protein
MKVQILFEVNRNHVYFTGKIRNHRNEDEFVVDFRDDAMFCVDFNSFSSIRVSVSIKSKLLYFFEIYHNDVVANLNKEVCFGELHAYMEDVVRKTSHSKLLESKIITCEDFQKKFYTRISHDIKNNRIVFDEFNLLLPTRTIDNYQMHTSNSEPSSP